MYRRTDTGHRQRQYLKGQGVKWLKRSHKRSWHFENHDMAIISTLLAFCGGNPPVTGLHNRVSDNLRCHDTHVAQAQHGIHPGPTGPRWAPYWTHEFCYQGGFHWNVSDRQMNCRDLTTWLGNRIVALTMTPGRNTQLFTNKWNKIKVINYSNRCIMFQMCSCITFKATFNSFINHV